MVNPSSSTNAELLKKFLLTELLERAIDRGFSDPAALFLNMPEQYLGRERSLCRHRRLYDGAANRSVTDKLFENRRHQLVAVPIILLCGAHTGVFRLFAIRALLHVIVDAHVLHLRIGGAADLENEPISIAVWKS